MPWTLFDNAAEAYESWYTSPQGRRADAAERALLEWLLASFPSAHSLLEIGCGTGHFTTWLAQHYPVVTGIERAPAMLSQLHRHASDLPLVLGDAHQLPFRSRAVDLTVFVTTVEFLDTPELALSEAMRIARHGMVLVVLNRWSRGGYSRRWGAQAQRTLLSQAHDYSLPALQAFVKRAAGPRLKKIFWSSTLFPGVLWKYRGAIPFGDVVGLAAVFSGSQERGRLTQPAALPALFSRTSLMLFNGGCCLDGTGVCHY